MSTLSTKRVTGDVVTNNMVLPKIEGDATSQKYGRFVISPLEQGFGITCACIPLFLDKRFVAQHLEGRTALRLRWFLQMDVLADGIDRHSQLLGNRADRLALVPKCLDPLVPLPSALYSRRNGRDSGRSRHGGCVGLWRG